MDPTDTERLRARLQALDESTLLRYLHASEFICSVSATGDDSPDELFIIQCGEAWKEWRRRHPKSARKPPVSIILPLD